MAQWVRTSFAVWKVLAVSQTRVHIGPLCQVEDILQFCVGWIVYVKVAKTGMPCSRPVCKLRQSPGLRWNPSQRVSPMHPASAFCCARTVCPQLWTLKWSCMTGCVCMMILWACLTGALCYIYKQYQAICASAFHCKFSTVILKTTPWIA